MKKLYQLVSLVSNTEDAVVLKVNEGAETDLICLGYFDGDETMFRLTKGRNHTCTVWTKKGTNYSWEWGDSGYDLVSSNMRKRGYMIKEAIEDGFDILVYGSKESIRKNMSQNNHTHQIVLWNNAAPGHDCGCRKDGEFFRYFDSIDEAKAYFKDLGYKLIPTDERPNFCNGTSYYYTLKKEN